MLCKLSKINLYQSINQSISMADRLLWTLKELSNILDSPLLGFLLYQRHHLHHCCWISLLPCSLHLRASTTTGLDAARHRPSSFCLFWGVGNWEERPGKGCVTQRMIQNHHIVPWRRRTRAVQSISYFSPCIGRDWEHGHSCMRRILSLTLMKTVNTLK